MKYFLFLFLFLLLFFISCSSDGSSSGKTESNLRKEGYNCRKDKTCNEGLFCNRNNICEVEQDENHLGEKGYPCKEDKTCNESLVCNENNICQEKEQENHLGEEGYECNENGSCNEGLICNSDNICEVKQNEEHLGEEGYPCKEGAVCDYDLFCNTDFICEKNDVVDFGKEGKPCIKVGDTKCLEDYLYCNERDLCVRFEGDAGEEGNPCKQDGSCNDGLMCALENICLNADDFNTGDMGQSCRVTDETYDFCYSGLTCDNFGECILDCSVDEGNLCTSGGEFDFSPYVGRYKLIRFEETEQCLSNEYFPKEDLNYEYFELTFENYYGFKYLAFHTCENSGSCSSTEKSLYRIVDFGGQTLMEFAQENEDGSCTYTSVDTYVRKFGNKIRLRYVFNEAVLSDSNDECSSMNVHNHYGEMTCAKIRIIDGLRE